VKIPKALRVSTWLFLFLALFCAWYTVAANYDYGAVSGTYVFQRGDESSTLILRKDRTFSQQRTSNGKVEQAQGTWRRLGEGGVNFSKEFLTVGGVQPESDGSTYGEVQKSFMNLIPSIYLGNGSGARPKFHLKFTWF
jgi:hypothetical protein